MDIEVYTVTEVAKMLKTSHHTIHELIRQGRIPHIRLGYVKATRIPKAEFEQWYASEVAASTAQAQARVQPSATATERE